MDIDLLCLMANGIRDVVVETYPYGGGGKVIRDGEDGDATKEIDLLAERAALDWLEENDIDWNVLSEESGRIERGGNRTLIIDPVDGTYNAVNGIPFYSTSLALTEKDGAEGIVSGVVLNIPTGVLYKAERGKGAYMDDVPINTRRHPDNDAVYSSFLGPGALDESRRVLSRSRRGRYFGAISLDICMVAKGGIDMFALFSRVPRITDIAAAHLILEEAGGMNIKIDSSNKWSDYQPGDTDKIKGILSIGDRRALQRILEISEVDS